MSEFKNISFEEHKKNQPPPTSRMKRERAWTKAKKILDFLGFINSSGGKRGARSNGSVHVANHSTSTPQSFRESQSFDPERAYVQRIQEIAYHQMVDGKGDPEPCDCDHDR